MEFTCYSHIRLISAHPCCLLALQIRKRCERTLWSRTTNQTLEKVFAAAPKPSTPEVDLIAEHFQMETRWIP
jgi:hypothetical protein